MCRVLFLFFACIYVCAPQACLVPEEARIGCWIISDCSLQMGSCSIAHAVLNSQLIFLSQLLGTEVIGMYYCADLTYSFKHFF